MNIHEYQFILFHTLGPLQSNSRQKGAMGNANPDSIPSLHVQGQHHSTPASILTSLAASI